MHRQEPMNSSYHAYLANWLHIHTTIHNKLIQIYSELPLSYWYRYDYQSEPVSYGVNHLQQQQNLHAELANLTEHLAECLEQHKVCYKLDFFNLFKDFVNKIGESHFLKFDLDSLPPDLRRVFKVLQAEEKILFDEYQSLIEWLSESASKNMSVEFNEKTMSAIKGIDLPNTMCESSGIDFDADQCPKEIEISSFNHLVAQLEIAKQKLLELNLDEKIIRHSKKASINIVTSASASFIIDMVGYLTKKTSGSNAYANAATTLTGIAITLYAGDYLSSAAFVATKLASRYVGFSDPTSNGIGLVAAAGVHVASDLSLSNLTNVGISMATAYGGSLLCRGASFFVKKGIDKTIECVRGKKEEERLSELKII